MQGYLAKRYHFRSCDHWLASQKQGSSFIHQILLIFVFYIKIEGEPAWKRSREEGEKNKTGV